MFVKKDKIKIKSNLSEISEWSINCKVIIFVLKGALFGKNYWDT